MLIETRKLPGISLTESVADQHSHRERILRSFPEVTGVVTKIGRPDLATEAMGIYEGDVYVLLKPREQWNAMQPKNDLIDADGQKRCEQMPGVIYNFTQPMAMRLDEVVSGIKADVAVKIFGEDPRTLETAGRAGACASWRRVPGAADAQMEMLSGVAELRVQVDRDALARYGSERHRRAQS